MDFPECKGLGYKRFLPRVHKNLEPEWYLEIGSSRGDSLAIAKSNSIAIDPRFAIKHDIWSGKDELHLFQMTSDDYFAQQGTKADHPKINLAFLDGMHWFEYLLRDFIGAERVASKDGLIMLHDCVPISQAASERDWDRSKTKQWTGDVWKVVPILRTYRPDLSIRVLDCPPSGLVMISDLDPENTVLTDNYDAIIEEYMDMSIDGFGMDKLHETLDLVHSESEGAAPFNKMPEG